MSDQRLSASKIFARAMGSPTAGAGRRDQRLSASKIFALEKKGSKRTRKRVINAFRHQRFLHFAQPGQLEAADT